MRFHNRIDAGRQLAAALSRSAGRSDLIVLAPRIFPEGCEIVRRLAIVRHMNLSIFQHSWPVPFLV
jgi:predicted phosphoribosyltransferase